MSSQSVKTDTQFAEEWADEARQDPCYGYMQAVMSFASQIHEELERRKLTQAEFAQSAQVSPSYISRVFNNAENLTVRTLFRLANAIGMSVEIGLRGKADDVERIHIDPDEIQSLGQFAVDELANFTAGHPMPDSKRIVLKPTTTRARHGRDFPVAA